MWEDAEIEAQVFPPGSRVFCIASAGCTALELARRGCVVTAVDVNPAQIAYLRRRLTGAPAEEGRAERLLAGARRLMPLAGWSRDRLREFCDLDSPDEQLRRWDEQLDGRRLRAGLAGVLNPLALRAVYVPGFVRALPRRFDVVLRRRLRRTFGEHPNRTNPFAGRLLLGEDESSPPVSATVEVVCADATDYLETVGRGTFDCFSLSNILDGATREYEMRLFRAVRRAGAPGLVYVLRSLREPSDPAEATWARRDRSLLWGSIRIARPA